MSFKRFDIEDVVVSAESVAAPLWTGDKTTLDKFFTSPTQLGSPSGKYYYDIYQTGSLELGARVQFSVAYGHKFGSGSIPHNPSVPGKSPSAAVYGQYRTLVLGDEEVDFTFGDVQSNHFIVLSVDRARYKETLLPGTMTLELGVSGSNHTVKLTDNSRNVSTVTYTDAGRVYELVSGSAGVVFPSGSGYVANSGSYGKFLPDVGIIMLNGNTLNAPTGSGGFGLGLSEANTVDGVNLQIFYDKVLKSTNTKLTLQSVETVSSNYVFVRARNAEFNYSTNPSMLTGSGDLRHSVMIDSPQTYITTVGLYNDNNDLLAVAKLSRPLQKDFTKETLIRVKLDY